MMGEREKEGKITAARSSKDYECYDICIMLQYLHSQHHIQPFGDIQTSRVQ
jgi:hypothetical protein